MKVLPITVDGFFSSSGVDVMMYEYQCECTVDDAVRNPDRETYLSMEKSGCLFVFGAYEGDRIVGFSTLTVFPDPRTSLKTAVLDTIFVSKNYRKSGVGSLLLMSLYAKAKDVGAKGILIEAVCGSRFEKLLSHTAERIRSTFYKPFKE